MSNLWKWAKFYLKPKVQRHVLMAFHYLPPNKIKPGGRSDDYIFMTEKNSPLAEELLIEMFLAYLDIIFQLVDPGRRRINLAIVHAYGREIINDQRR